MKIIIPFLLITLVSCNQKSETTKMNNIAEYTDIKAEDINKLVSKKIYFGHQSVGYNIIDGLNDLLSTNSKIIIKETLNPKDFSKPLFAHSQNGENTKPETKIHQFESTMNNSLGKFVDIAFFKFCYIDITADTNIDNLFKSYQQSFNNLRAAYPDITFFHITVPLTTEEHSLIGKFKYIIKNIIGKRTGREYDNIQRMRFNEKLIATYGIKVFDLARLESTQPDGLLITSTYGGVTHYILLPEYTNDGGHLNKEGSKYIAFNLINYMKNLK